jgi:hypothetical protein
VHRQERQERIKEQRDARCLLFWHVYLVRYRRIEVVRVGDGGPRSRLA